MAGRTGAAASRATGNDANASKRDMPEAARLANRAYAVFARSRRSEPAASAKAPAARQRPTPTGGVGEPEPAPRQPPQPSATPAQAEPRQTIAPTAEQIRVRAYYIYLARAGAPGSPEADWAEAQRQLRAELTSSA